MFFIEIKRAKRNQIRGIRVEGYDFKIIQLRTKSDEKPNCPISFDADVRFDDTGSKLFHVSIGHAQRLADEP
jgi:hypothetical protein